jgi:CBS domain containing-hemolysin-like protein
MTGELILIAILILIQGFFSGSEMAIVSSDRLVLKNRADEGDVGAARVLRLLARPARLVGTCLIGTNLALIGGSTAAAHLLHTFGDLPEIVVIVTFTPITIVFAELLPKSIFRAHATRIAPVVAPVLTAISIVLSPALAAVEWITRAILRALGAGETEPNTVRREDIRLLLDNAEKTDIHADEKEMILRVFHFSETLVQDAMVPLIEVIGIPETVTCDEAAALMVEAGFSRMPVFRKRIDRIVGQVMHSDLLFAADGSAPVSTVMQEILFVPETKPVDATFLDLRRKRKRLAVAVDEYGGAVGMISIEDILEEIVGDIDDEFDRRRPVVRRVGEKEWVASGRVEAEQLLASTGFSTPGGDYETLAGFLLTRFGHVPGVGERFSWGTYVFTVTLANERAILEVGIQDTR